MYQSMYVCNNDRPEFYEEERRVARKNHECQECHAEIPSGSKYLRWAGKIGYEFISFKLCQRCEQNWEELSDAVYDAVGEACLCYGLLKDKISEAMENDHIDLERNRNLIERWHPQFKEILPEESCLMDGIQMHFEFA